MSHNPPKTASSQVAWALLAEGVTGARVETHRLRHMLNRALALVEASDQSEELYRLAGDLIHGVPQRMDRLELVLDRTSLALAKMGAGFLEARLPLSDKAKVEEAVQPAFGGGTSRYASIDRVALRWLQANGRGDGRYPDEVGQYVRKAGVFDSPTCLHLKTAKPIKAIYTGVFLADPNQLLNWWKKNVGQLHPTVKAHHMTIKFKPSEAEVTSLTIGSSVGLKIVGYAQDDKGQAVLVKPQGIRSTNRMPHITVAVNGVSPAYSNNLLTGGVTKVSGPVLKGRVGFFSTKQKDVFDVAGTLYDPANKVASIDRVALCWLEANRRGDGWE